MAVEPVSLTLGIGAMALALKGAVDSALFVESFFDKDMRSYGYLATCYGTERAWLQMWHDECGICEGHDGILHERPDYLKKQVIHILNTVNDVNRDADAIIKKYKLITPDVSVHDLEMVARTGASTTARRITDLRPNSRGWWIVKAKPEFEKIIGRFRQQNNDLERLTLAPEMRDGLASRFVSSLDQSKLVDFAKGMHIEPKSSVSLAASAKSLQSSLENQRLDFTVLTKDDFKELHMRNTNTAATGTLSVVHGEDVPVWIEWVTLDRGIGSSSTPDYIHRINCLGGLLQEISDPLLHLLPCRGVFRDMEYQHLHKTPRLGYVFGLPPGHGYEEDLLDYPPISLREHILATKSHQRPFLGDRFKLAYSLASSFSLIHAAGWLHKGLHAGSITFLRKANRQDSEIDLADPFVTGFQYSRPRSSSSLSWGPLQNEDLNCYYPPDIDQGFTKRRDLYGLGVILIEIGRWGLVIDSGREKDRHRSRQKWHDSLLKHSVPEMGWRMGEKYQMVVRTLLKCELPADERNEEFFFEQFQKKILEPLHSCSA